MALTIEKIVDKLVKDHGLMRREALDLVETMVMDMKKSIAAGERVKLPEFGSFELRKQQYQRKRRDIPVDEDTPKFMTPSFTSSSILRARVQRAGIEKARDVD